MHTACMTKSRTGKRNIGILKKFKAATLAAEFVINLSFLTSHSHFILTCPEQLMKSKEETNKNNNNNDNNL